MACNPMVIHFSGAWQAWCKPCAWESSWTNQWSLAVHWCKEHGAVRAVRDSDLPRTVVISSNGTTNER